MNRELKERTAAYIIGCGVAWISLILEGTNMLLYLIFCVIWLMFLSTD